MYPANPDLIRQSREELRREVAAGRLARRGRGARRGRPGKDGGGRAVPVLVPVLMALLSLSIALALVSSTATPAQAQQASHTLTVSASGGKVTGPGIDCGAGATDCSQSYEEEARRVCEIDPETGDRVCTVEFFPAQPTLTATTPAGFQFAGWGGACAGTGGTCRATMDADKTVSARWNDLAPPTVSLDEPAGSYVSGTATLRATAGDNDRVSRVEFFAWERKIGEDASAPYEASLNTTTLPDGQAMLRAVAHDRSGRSAENRRWPVVDNTAPLLEITGGPDGGTYRSDIILGWTFRASDQTSGLPAPPQCAVVPAASSPDGEYGACSSEGQHVVSNLPDGDHRFWVKATDGAGNAAERSRSFTVDGTAPETTITSGPEGFARSASATFAFSSSESGAHSFECSLDASDFAPCSSPKAYSGLANGEHTFRVRARDAKNNTDESPATRTWTVDTVRPSVSATTPKGGAKIRDATPMVRALVRDPQMNLIKANVRLYVDGRAKSFSYSSATDRLVHRSKKLKPGRHAVRIVAKDAAGNAASKAWRFTVKRR